MLYNEERPSLFSGVVGQEHIVTNVLEQSRNDNFFNVYILSGQYGSGKTTIARIIKLAANCHHKHDGNPCLKCDSCLSILNDSNIDCVEIDGASNNGVDQVRTLISNSMHYPASSKYKIFIIDEVHMLSKSAFNALLKTLEEPPSWCIFILCTTELDAIPETVRSRAAKYIFKRIPSEQIVKHLKNVSNKHNFSITDDALVLIAKYSYGSMRNALNLLEQCSNFNKSINEESVKSLVGIENTATHFKLLQCLIDRDNIGLIQVCNEIYENSVNISLLLNDLLEVLTDASIYSATKNTSLIDNTDEYIENIIKLCNSCTLETIFRICNELQQLKSAKDYSKASIIVSLMKISNNLTITYDVLLARITELEKKIASGYQMNSTPQVISEVCCDTPDNEGEYYHEAPPFENDYNDYSYLDGEIEQFESCESPFSEDTSTNSFSMVTETDTNTNIIEEEPINASINNTIVNEDTSSLIENETIQEKEDAAAIVVNDSSSNMLDTEWLLDMLCGGSQSSQTDMNEPSTSCKIEEELEYTDPKSKKEEEIKVEVVVDTQIQHATENEVFDNNNETTSYEQNKIDEYNELISNPIIKAAIHGCKVEFTGETVVITSKIQPIVSIIQAHITVNKYSMITVKREKF